MSEGKKSRNNTAQWKCLCPYFLRDNNTFIVCDISEHGSGINGIRIMFNSEQEKINFQNKYCFDRDSAKDFNNITHKYEQCPYVQLANSLYEADQ